MSIVTHKRLGHIKVAMVILNQEYYLIKVNMKTEILN